MSYLIYFGLIVAAGGVLLLISDAFAHEVSRGVEAMFDRIEYRLALRARERQMLRREAQVSNANVSVTPFRVAVEGQRKGSTQQLGVARVAA
jgi:hypothetical protein